MRRAGSRWTRSRRRLAAVRLRKRRLVRASRAIARLRASPTATVSSMAWLDVRFVASETAGTGANSEPIAMLKPAYLRARAHAVFLGLRAAGEACDRHCAPRGWPEKGRVDEALRRQANLTRGVLGPADAVRRTRTGSAVGGGTSAPSASTAMPEGDSRMARTCLAVVSVRGGGRGTESDAERPRADPHQLAARREPLNRAVHIWLLPARRWRRKQRAQRGNAVRH
jgi:hypothetical protein